MYYPSTKSSALRWIFTNVNIFHGKISASPFCPPCILGISGMLKITRRVLRFASIFSIFRGHFSLVSSSGQCNITPIHVDFKNSILFHSYSVYKNSYCKLRIVSIPSRPLTDHSIFNARLRDNRMNQRVAGHVRYLGSGCLARAMLHGRCLQTSATEHTSHLRPVYIHIWRIEQHSSAQHGTQPEGFFVRPRCLH